MREPHPCPLGGCPNAENIPQKPELFLNHFSAWHTKAQGEAFLAIMEYENNGKQTKETPS